MMRKRYNLRWIAGAIPALMLLASHAAYADALSPTMRIWLKDLDSGKGIVITDEGVKDANTDIDWDGVADPVIGLISYSGNVGSFGVSFTTAMSQPYVGGVYNDSQLVLNSTNIRSTKTGSTGHLQIVLEDYNYGPESGSRTLQSHVSGILTGGPNDSATFFAYANADNSVPDLGPDTATANSALGPLDPSLQPGATAVWPGGIAFGLPAGQTTTSFAGDGGALFVPDADGNPSYSLFSQLLVTLTGQSSLSLSNLSVEVTPEPVTMLLFGSGAAALAAARRRRQKKDKQLITC